MLLQLVRDVFEQHWRLLLELSIFVVREWLSRRRLSRQRSWQFELSARASAEHTSEHNRTIETMSTAYACEEQPTLEDLLSRAERDWSLRSSDPPSRKTPEASYNRLVERSSRPPPPPRKR